jgi:hypothetical protein
MPAICDPWPGKRNAITGEDSAIQRRLEDVSLLNASGRALQLQYCRRVNKIREKPDSHNWPLATAMRIDRFLGYFIQIWSPTTGDQTPCPTSARRARLSFDQAESVLKISRNDAQKRSLHGRFRAF